MDLFVFIRHSDPIKVRIGEREPAEREEHSIERDDDVLEETVAKDILEVAVEKTKKKWKRKATRDASGSTLPPKKLREDHHVATPNIGEKSLATIHSLILEGSSVPSGVTASVTPISDGGNDGPTDFVSRLNLRTRPLSMRYGVSSYDSHHSGSRIEVNSFTRSLVADAPVIIVAVTTTIAADVSIVSASKGGVKPEMLKMSWILDSFYAFQDLDSETLPRIYVPKWKVTNDSVLDDLYVCHDLTDRLTPPALFSQLLAMDYDLLYSEFNVGAVRQMCLETKKDAEIVDLKSLLSLKEAETIEAIRLLGQLAVVEAADAVKGNELRDLKEKNFVLEGEKDVLYEKVTTLESASALKETGLVSLTAQVAQLVSELSSFQLSRDELSSKVDSLKSERDRLADQRSSLKSGFELFRGRMEAMQDEQAIVLGIQDGLKAGVDHGKAGRDLSVIEAYDPFAEAKYIKAVNALGIVDISFLFELESKKDASMVNLIYSLRLEGPLAEIPRVEDLVKGEIKEKSLSLTDVTVPLAEPLSSKSLIGEASTSAAPATAGPITTLSTTFFLPVSCLLFSLSEMFEGHFLSTGLAMPLTYLS
nr:hypothetical protein [Tanacetum cinerariifolium]GEW62749.1 hypothetical protein [Tanacetum cinerariifolium]